MDYFENHLPKGEEIKARTRKSLLIFMREIFIGALLAGIIVGLQLGAKISQDIMLWIYVAAGIIELLFISHSLIKYSSTVLVVTNQKFMFKEDIVTIRVFDTLLQNIDGVEIEYKTPLRRAMNVGNIIIRTKSSEHIFRNISRPDIFTAVLNKQAAALQSGRSGTVRIAFGLGQPKADTNKTGNKQQGEIVKGKAKRQLDNK